METERITKCGFSFLAPDKVGSSVRYVLNASEHYNEKRDDWSRSFSGSVFLTDCSGSISWESDDYGKGSGIPHLRKKLKKAIKVLEKCLDDLCEVEAEYKRYSCSED